MRKFIFLFAAILFFCGTVFAADFPQFEDFVTDTTGTLSKSIIVELNEKLANYEAETGTEIAVALVDSTDGEPIEMYATNLGNAWGVGKANTDNGAILVVAVADRELFLATGSQLEGAVTDIEAREIVDEVITPYFRNGDFDGGISAGVDAIFAAVNGESFTDLRMENTVGGGVEIGNFVFVVLFFVLPWLAAIFGRSKKIWPGGVAGAVAGSVGGGIFLGGILGILGAAVGLGIFGLIFDAAVSRNYAKAGKRGHVAWWAGGGRGGSGFGGGGFGGFGGGGFSGGGFGGKW
jgi:uncharacterized protein